MKNDEPGTDPAGTDCWCKPCQSALCAEFGPENCAGREDPDTTSSTDDSNEPH